MEAVVLDLLINHQVPHHRPRSYTVLYICDYYYTFCHSKNLSLFCFFYLICAGDNRLKGIEEAGRGEGKAGTIVTGLGANTEVDLIGGVVILGGVVF